MGDFELASSLFEEAIRSAQRADAAEAEGVALMSRAGLHAMAGRIEDALADLEQAGDLVAGPASARLAVQRANVVHQAGDLAKADSLYAVALEQCRAQGLLIEEARILSNRSLLMIERAAYDDAHQSLKRASTILQDTGRSQDYLPVAHNLGYLALCRGLLADAVAHLDAHRSAALRAGASPYAASADLAEALLAAGLTEDAERESMAAAAHFERTGARQDAAHAYVAGGRAALAAGKAADAVASIEQGLSLSESAARSAWRAAYESMLVEAHLSLDLTEKRTPSERAELKSIIDSAVNALGANGLVRHRQRAQLVQIRLAIDGGDLREARAIAAELRTDRRLGVEERSSVWHLLGLVELTDGRPDRAARALGRAMAAAHAMRRTVQWLETTTAGIRQTQIGTDGLRATLAGTARPIQLLWWMEATYRTTPPERPGTAGDHRVQDALTTARRASHRLALSLDDEASADELAAATQELADAEDRAARALRTAGPSRTTRTNRSADVRADIRSLDGRHLLEFAEVDGRLLAVTARKGRLRKHDLGSVDVLGHKVSSIRSLARSCWWRSNTLGPLREALNSLDQIVVPPAVRADDEPLVVVPSKTLLPLPFGLLPSLAGRRFTCAPSLATHTSAHANHSPIGRPQALFVAGPGLPRADEEVRSAGSVYPRRVVLTAGDSSAERVLTNLDADLVHIASHGRIRHDAPLFSALLLRNGPLVFNDFVQLQRIPPVVVLSACEIARPIHRASGTSTLPGALLSLGAVAVVASSLVIPDAVSAERMVALHRAFADGASVEDALADLRTSGDPLQRLVAATFLVHGAGNIKAVDTSGR